MQHKAVKRQREEEGSAVDAVNSGQICEFSMAIELYLEEKPLHGVCVSRCMLKYTCYI